MKLEKVVLHGFKSFADKTEFDFNKPITAIVGPNGCGKSNVIDAVKWVLGNQSPKSLRSGQMTDVIFNGSGSRKPSGMAEVSLVFSDVGTLGMEQDCLEISRRLYRSGESEYLINQKTCRLRDIREMFMDTGIGVSAYSIIEQGQIEQLLHASKVDRRTIFEEAAGISRYKAQKKETLRKLERTEQNMLRLADIISEVAKQLRSIKHQAGKARSYLQYSQRLKELRLNYSLSEYHRINTETSEKNSRIAGLQEKFGSVVADVARDDASLSEMRAKVIETETQINRWDNTLVAAKGKIEQQLEKIEFLKTRTREFSQRKTAAVEQIKKLNVQAGLLTEDMALCQTELKQVDLWLTEKTASITNSENQLCRISDLRSSTETSLNDEKSGIIDIVRRTAQLHNEIQSINAQRNSLSGQKDRLSGRADDTEAQLKQLLTERAAHQARLDDIVNIIADLQQKLETKRSELADSEKSLDAGSKQLADAKETRSGLSGEFKVLSDMEANRQGLSSTLKNILRDRTGEGAGKYDYIEGIVADIISADADYAVAVEAALEGKTDALVINSTGAFLKDADIQQKIQSRVQIICLDKTEPFTDTADLSGHPAVLGRLVEFITCQPRYAPLAWNLLGHTILVDSADSAIELASALGTAYRFVTPAGQVFDRGFFISTGPVGKTSGLISRKSRITQLGRLIEEINNKISLIEKDIIQHNRQKEHITDLCKDLRTAIYEASTEKVNTDSKLAMFAQNIKRLTDEKPLIAGEIQLLQQQIQDSVGKEYQSKQKLQELEQINTERTTRIAELQKLFQQHSHAYNEQAVLLTELKVQTGRLAEQQKSISQKITGLQSQLQHSRSAVESARTDLCSCDDQILLAERDTLKAHSLVSEFFVEKENACKISIELHKNVETLLDRQKITEQKLRNNRVLQAETEQQMHQVQIELGQLAVRSEELITRVRQELQIELAQAYQTFDNTNIDWEQVQAEITELREKIERLGNVNIDAITEQEQLQQRYEFLAAQADDLNKSKSQLEQLIARINRESHDKFLSTFEEVRTNFQALFRKLFGGGKADIMLEDPNDILESGIEIIARPPGKEPRSISLLSGGEKTLTAIGLLFAIFRTKPSPFCFLDEVDAALDEANNERFNIIVQEFRQYSQFIIVTHSKRTMSIADMLFGITMQTHGVSKKISVTFDSVETETGVAVA